MRKPHLELVLVALALGGISASTATAQNFLAVSEVVGGSNEGRVAIYQQRADGSINTSIAPIIVSGNGLANPFGVSYDSANTSLYIASLGSNRVFAYNVTTQSLAPVLTLPTGFHNPGGLLVSGTDLYVSAFNGGSAGSPGAVLEYNLSNLAAAPTIFSGGGLIGPTGLAVDNNGTVFVNSSENGKVFALTSSTPSPTALTDGGNPSILSASAGLVFGTAANGTAGLLFETNVFDQFNGSPYHPSLSSYDSSGALVSNIPGGYLTPDPPFGGATGITLGPNSGQILVSDYGDGIIYQYTSDANGNLSGPTFYLSLQISNGTPAYITEFDPPTGTINGQSVPEPSSLALLGLGTAAGLIAIRRRGRAVRGPVRRPDRRP